MINHRLLQSISHNTRLKQPVTLQITIARSTLKHDEHAFVGIWFELTK